MSARATSTAFERAVLWGASALFCAISLWPHEGVAKYRWSFVFLVPILWLAFALRRRLALLPLDFALFALALLLHDLGAFGGYSRTIAGLQFDWCVHTFFGFVGGLVVARLLELRLGLRGLGHGLLVVLVVTGIGGLHEIVEAATTRFLGADYGMFYIGPDNMYDTQEDLLCNVVGASLALVLHALRRRRVAQKGPS